MVFHSKWLVGSSKLNFGSKNDNFEFGILV
jgi:hypothetical protein